LRWFAVAVFGFAGFLLGAVVAFPVEYLPPGPRHVEAGRIALGIGAFIGIASGSLIAWATPAPELLQAGQVSRLRRVRLAVWAAVVAVVTGVVSAIVYGAVAGR
jgi:hypothetical protein